jgi:hypothetical protein
MEVGLRARAIYGVKHSPKPFEGLLTNKADVCVCEELGIYRAMAALAKWMVST